MPSQLSILSEKIKLLEAQNKQLLEKNEVLEGVLKKKENLNAERTIKEQNEQLLKYNKELEQFTYVATHDLKSPLANIQGYLQLLELDIDTDNSSSEILDSLKWLKYSVEEAREVIRELTNALKARNNKEELRKTINLEYLVEGILSGMRSRILNSKTIIISDFTEINNFAYYPVALRSILQNIISNAIQYSSTTKNPEIIIRTEKIQEDIYISIKDNGPGIDLKNNKTKVFGLFKRVSNDEYGSGIGMYIVNKLLENYGGKLNLESELGKGSIFTVVIPYQKD